MGVVALIAGLGSAAGGPKRWVPADLMSGWGMMAVLFTLNGIAHPHIIPLCALVVWVVAFLAIERHIRTYNRVPWPYWFLIALGLQVWVLFLINRAGISGWDDIGQWAPNALYLWKNGGFPDFGMPPTYSSQPGYPYALAYLDYMTSPLHKSFLVQAGSMINWLLLASFAWALTEYDEPAAPRTVPQKLMRLGVALAMVTIVNPGFNASFTVTGQSDTATSVEIGFLGLLLLRLHAAMQEGKPEQIRPLLLQIALAGVVLVLTRDMNVVLLLLLFIGAMAVALRAGTFGPSGRMLALAMLPGLIFFALWHHYIQHAIAQNKEFLILPWAQWRWPMVPQMLAAAGKEMLKKNGFYILMFATGGFGIWAFFRGRLDKFGALGILTAVTFFGTVGFVLTAYTGGSIFPAYTMTSAMSFFRYSTHTGLLGIAMAWFAFERFVEPRLKPGALIPVAAFGFGLLPLVYVIRPAALVPEAKPALCAERAFGDEIARRLPPKIRLAILDYGGNSFEIFIIRFQLGLDDLRTGSGRAMVGYTDVFQPELLPPLMKRLQDPADINAVLLTKPTPELKKFFGIMGDNPRDLLLRKGDRWQPLELPKDIPP